VLRADGIKISARVDNSFRKHVVTLTTNDRARELPMAPRADGVDSSMNGVEYPDGYLRPRPSGV
jgi:hypothetical protein